MNLFQLVFKQMRQRSLGTWLTTLSVLLGVALAVSIFLMRQAGAALFGQTEYGYDVLVGVGRGSPLQLTLNTVYHIDKSPGNVPYWVYETLNTQNRPPRGSKEFNFNSHVKTAVPIAVGDTYKGRPIIGAPPKMFVSLRDLHESIDDTRGKVSVLLGDVQNGAGADAVAGFASRATEIQGSVDSIRKALKKTAQETTPLIEQVDPLAPPNPDDARWRYGRPITFRADDAVNESAALVAALSAKDAGLAAKHDKALLDDLDAIYKSVGAENGPLEYIPDRSYELADGRLFHAWKFEAVIGSEVAQNAGLKIGSSFQATHGNPLPSEIPDIHKEVWTVVGVLKPTHTSADRGVYIPLVTFYTIAEHEVGEGAHSDVRSGLTPKAAAPDDDDVPKYKKVFGDELDPDLPHVQEYVNVDAPTRNWEVSAILVKSRGGVAGDNLMYFIQNGGLKEDVQAVNPARVMREFFDTFFAGSTTILLVIAALVSVVAAIGILVSIYNSVSARNREIAILRALGATRQRVLTLICVEAVFIGLIGGLLGLVVGHLLGGVGSTIMSRRLGQGFDWVASDAWEWIYLAGVVLIALAAGLVPATKAYRTPVATNLLAA